jgi:hypothetical protein
MPPRRLAIAAPAAACCLLAACGDSGPAAVRCTPPPTASPAVISAGPLTARTDRGAVAAGDTVKVSVDVAGPAAYSAPCEGPVQLVAIDSTDLHVGTASAPAPKGTPCGAVTLAAGQTAHYEVLWTSDDTLPPGRYSLVASLGDQAALSVPVTIGAGPFASTC